jgi:hypothetical protein
LAVSRLYGHQMDRLVPARAQAVLAGVVAAVIAYVVGWTLLLGAFVSLLLLTGRTPVGLGHWSVALALLAGASVAGLRFGHRRWASGPADISVGDLARWLAIVSVYAAVMAGVLMWQRMHEEQRFLAVFPPAVAADQGDALVSAGYDACEWLQEQPWGQPGGPELSSLTNKGEPIAGLPEGYLTYLPSGRPVGPPGSTTSTRSTTTLSIQYAESVDAQYPPSQADEQELRIQTSKAAWYNLCPLSREIRRPLESGGD